jgi:polyphosphate kinase
MGQPLFAGRLPQSQTSVLPSTRDEATDLFLDRDLSLIAFYRRVFDEARDEANPLLERVRFLGIVGSVIDEFAVTRYAELAKKGTGTFFLRRIETEIIGLLTQARSYLRAHMVPALAAEGIHLVDCAGLEPKERAEVDSHFTASVLPLLMPLGFDAARPFPHVSSRTTVLAVIVRHAGKDHFACVQVPDTSPALVPFHWRRSGAAGSAFHHPSLEQGFVWLADVIAENLAAVFPGMDIVGAYPFRVFRDADLDTDLPDGVVLRDAVERGLRRRKFGDLVALMVADRMPSWLVELLSENLRIPAAAVHRCGDLVDLAKLHELARLERSELHHPPLVPRAASDLDTCQPGRGIFASIRQGDLLLHHPYESFQPVIDFIETAAVDPDVLAISTTLYRAGRNSPIVDALLEARRAGKQVRVVIELRARFDEENNIAWGRALQEAGAHVAYGMVGLKVHAKLTLIVRREAGHLRRYVHLSSGNYNPVTSTVYTDLALLSCREDIGSDATQLFNALSGYALPTAFHTLVVAPLTLRTRVKNLIEREAAWARQGQAAHMILKMNALADQEIVESLYRASRAGVRIDLIVRGICCLRPGIPGVSDTIRVVSIVGRFLEHSRAWYFRNGGNEEIYLGSADLMPRNLDERVEVMVRLDDVQLKQRVRDDILGVYLADNVKARELMGDGTYVRVGRQANDPVINSQESLL